MHTYIYKYTHRYAYNWLVTLADNSTPTFCIQKFKNIFTPTDSAYSTLTGCLQSRRTCPTWQVEICFPDCCNKPLEV